MSSVYAVAGMSTESDWSFVTSITTTSLFSNTDCKSSLLVIGKQQWGYNRGTTATNDTFTFPVAFSTACYTVITSVKWDTNDGYSARPITAFTKTNFTMYVKRSDFYICWISVGKQQWGEFLTTSSQFATYPLTISMSNNLYHIFGNHIGITQSTYAVIFGNKTLNTFDCKSGVGSQIVNWFVFGWQQWGYYEAASTLTVTLPIAFSSIDYAITLSPKTKSDAMGHRWKDKTLTTFGVDRISGVSTSGNFHAFGW